MEKIDQNKFLESVIKKIKIIHQEKNFLIIYKPAGLIVHSGLGVKETALSDILVSKFPEIKEIGENPDRPGIVHRLDKEVGGLLIVPRNQASFIFFKDKFKKRLIDKAYSALIHGQVVADQDFINFSLFRSQRGGKMSALPLVGKNFYKKEDRRNLGNRRANLSAREAETEILVKQRFINFTLLTVKIKTGRTHQIRAHLNAYGHPLLGDNLYSHKKTRIKNQKIKLGRIFLEADRLAFVDPDGKLRKFQIKLPVELENFLKTLK